MRPVFNKDVAEMSLFAILASANAFELLSVMELAMRSARSGSVPPTADATPHSADAFGPLLAMESAMRLASPKSRAARPNHRHQDITGIDRATDRVNVIHPRLDRIHVHEDTLRSEPVHEAVR
jgi:hypothetical protein